MSTPPATGLSSQQLVFLEAVERFKDSLSDREREEFGFTTRDDLRDAITTIQEKQASEKKMRNLTRLKRFLEVMDEYGKVIEVFLNASQFIAFVWVSLGSILATYFIKPNTLTLETNRDQ